MNMTERNLRRALFVGLSREMAKERGAMRRDARRDDDDDDDDEDDDDEALLSIKMANYPTNKRHEERERERRKGERERETTIGR